MRTVILCGGQGTRLREETEYRPKPLVEIGGRPILWHIMKLYSHWGFRDFVLCLGYRGWMIKEYFLNYEAMSSDITVNLGRTSSLEYHDAHTEQDYRVTLAETGLETQTGGRVARVKRHVDSDLFMLTYGDGIGDIPIAEVVKFHKSHGRIATVTTVQPTSRYGMIDIDPGGQVQAFTEKPRIEGWASAGFFVLDRKVFDYLGGDDCIFEQEPLQKLARDGQMLAYRHTGCFYTMDTYREYLALNRMWSANEAPWKVWT